jgi:hypothetical protein
MRSVLFTAFAICLLPVLAAAQPKPYTPACPGDVPAGVVLNICRHEHGMAPIPQPRLYLRVYADGRAEYERGDSKEMRLERKEFRLSEVEVGEIVRLGSTENFQAAQPSYPAYRQGDDSWIETTVIFRNKQVEKKIVLKNFFFAADPENALHYPHSLLALMTRAEGHWEKANGIVRAVPAINYCEMIQNRKRYFGKKVSVYAYLKRSMITSYTDPGPQRYGEYLYDTDCDNADVTGIRGKGVTGVGFGVEGTAADSLRQKISRLAEDRFGPRARVWATGILREEPGDSVYVYRYRFDIEEFKSFEQHVLPFTGPLEQGWVYSDTFEYDADAWVIKLSQPVKRPGDDPVRLLWKNEKDFPALKKSGLKHMVFRVITRTSDRVASGLYETVYFCEILELK